MTWSNTMMQRGTLGFGPGVFVMLGAPFWIWFVVEGLPGGAMSTIDASGELSVAWLTALGVAIPLAGAGVLGAAAMLGARRSGIRAERSRDD